MKLWYRYDVPKYRERKRWRFQVLPKTLRAGRDGIYVCRWLEFVKVRQYTSSSTGIWFDLNWEDVKEKDGE